MNVNIPQKSEFAAISINALSVSSNLPQISKLDDGRYLFANPALEVEEYFQKQWGEIKTKEIKENSLLLLVLVPLEGSGGLFETELKRSVRSLLYSLFLQGVYFSNGGTLLCGSNSAGYINIRSHQELDPYFRPRETVTAALDDTAVNQVGLLATGLESMYIAKEHYKRLKRGFHSYLDGVKAVHEETRMRHFVRSIEAFIRPAIGKTRSHFVHRGQLFVGPSHDISKLLGNLYDLRSCAEHMNDIHDLYAGLSEKEIDKRTAMGSFQSEVIANYVYRRAFENPEILKNFASDSSIKAVWEKPSKEQKEIWGESLNVSNAIKERFNPHL
jgi:hypothetical protein